MDDVLGQDISRSRLAAEDEVYGSCGQDPPLDLQILADHIERAQLLALVLVDPLDLQVIDPIRKELYSLPHPDISGKFSLCFALDPAQFLQRRFIISEVSESFHKGLVELVIISYFVRDPV